MIRGARAEHPLGTREAVRVELDPAGGVHVRPGQRGHRPREFLGRKVVEVLGAVAGDAVKDLLRLGGAQAERDGVHRLVVLRVRQVRCALSSNSSEPPGSRGGSRTRRGAERLAVPARLHASRRLPSTSASMSSGSNITTAEARTRKTVGPSSMGTIRALAGVPEACEMWSASTPNALMPV